MKKVKYLLIAILIVSSFFVTEKVVTYSNNKNPIMKKIKSVSKEYQTKGENATIIDDTIIPGTLGKEVNISESFRLMKSLGYFDANYFVYNYSIPSISISNNPNKIIVTGNKSKKSISLILKNNVNILNYSLNNNIKIDILATLESFDSSLKIEQVNNDTKYYDSLETLLNKYDKNKNICIINYISKNLCLKKDKTILKISKIVDNSSIIKIKNNLNYGEFYLIDDALSLENYKILINEIKYRDINILYLSELIAE